jgi:hypothetical protein
MYKIIDTFQFVVAWVRIQSCHHFTKFLPLTLTRAILARAKDGPDRLGESGR